MSEDRIDHDEQAQDFYRHVLAALQKARIPFLIGGAYAFERYTGIVRRTKDLDIFVLPDDCPRVLTLMAAGGYQTDLTFPTWLGKIRKGEHFVDVIFNGANAIVPVDDEWFAHAGAGELLDIPVRLCPAEEMIWSKAYVMARERFDGADIAHLFRAQGHTLDWQRLMRRFGAHWQLLLSHITLFGFIYPAERDQVPAWAMRDLLQRLTQQLTEAPPTTHICRGTLLSWDQYLIDTEQWDYADGRALPHGTLTAAEVAHLEAQQHIEQDKDTP